MRFNIVLMALHRYSKLVKTGFVAEAELDFFKDFIVIQLTSCSKYHSLNKTLGARFLYLSIMKKSTR